MDFNRPTMRTVTSTGPSGQRRGPRAIANPFGGFFSFQDRSAYADLFQGPTIERQVADPFGGTRMVATHPYAQPWLYAPMVQAPSAPQSSGPSDEDKQLVMNFLQFLQQLASDQGEQQAQPANQQQATGASQPEQQTSPPVKTSHHRKQAQRPLTGIPYMLDIKHALTPLTYIPGLTGTLIGAGLGTAGYLMAPALNPGVKLTPRRVGLGAFYGGLTGLGVELLYRTLNEMFG